MQKFIIIFLVAVLFTLTPQTVRAVNDRPIFSCSAPIGTIIASYSSGTHGIPGDYGTHTGSDTVYQVNTDHVLQCFCPDNGQSGIQSNWLKVSDLSQEELYYYQKLGWVYVPNGSLWGLDEASFLVKNDSYECRSSEGGSGGSGSGNSGNTGGNNGGSSNSGSNSSVSNGSGSNGSSTSDSGIGGLIGNVLGITALANTGSARTILFFIVVGGFFAWAAFRLRRE